ncbi:MAG: PHP domain-containing protein, partial [Oscillospiraceae bacterium]
MLYDLHLHTCLSPCANEDMTPSTVAGMAKLAGADLIAVTDHNSALNLPAAQKACDAYGLRLLPGIEVNTAEEIHLLCYFPSVKAALCMSDIIYSSLPDFEYDY